MSNNPFSKSKETNNRFNFLQPIETHLKKEKKNISTYNSKDNSFTKELNRRDDRRDDRRSHNSFKNSSYSKKEESKPIFDFTNENFPELISEKIDTIQQSKTLINFKDVLNTQIKQEIIDEKDIINPGWVQITKSKINNKIILKHGIPTEYGVQLKKQEELENDLNYNMNRGIEKMKYRWEKYKSDYDNMNGEGAYDEKYTLPPVYGSEYDTEDETEYDSDDNCYEE